MQKVLVVCGPTATGKTKLALHLAEQFDGEIISADSRQVYKYLDIVTGKDRELVGNNTVHGYDLVTPDQDFSAKLYSDYARDVIDNISSRGKLPIIEGGTGFYIDATLKNFENITVPKNDRLRKKYENLESEKLFNLYMHLFPQKAIILNDSDRKNKRRLLRHLEIADFELRGYALENSSKKELYDTFWVGLNFDSREKLYDQIDRRVEARLGKDLEKEIKFLEENNYLKKAESTTPGYKFWNNPEKWKTAEHQYAKRQLTWFLRNKKINWFMADSKSLNDEVDSIVSKWYS